MFDFLTLQLHGPKHVEELFLTMAQQLPVAKASSLSGIHDHTWLYTP
jgi:hypothetical protein